MKAAAFVWVCAMSSLGCAAVHKTRVEQASLERASRELFCPQSQLTAANRTDIDEHVFDVSGCGRRARYMCFRLYQSGTQCVREPNPDPGEEAARPKAPPPAPPQPRKVTDIPR